MPKKRKKKRGGKRAPPKTRSAGKGTTRRPLVHVQLVHAGGRLDDAAALAKPAILYADKVSIYSPTASLLADVRQLARVSKPNEQFAVMRELAEAVPALGAQLQGVDEATLNELGDFLNLDPALVRSRAKASGYGDEVENVYEQIEDMRRVWDEQLSSAIRESEDVVGGRELFSAIDHGAVEVADLSGATMSETVAESLRAASGDTSSTGLLDDLLLGFMSRIIELVVEPFSFPLLDADASDLIRSFRASGSGAPTPESHRGTEITAAARFMGYLPYFADLPMDEILDLRSALKTPLVRFRAAMAQVSQDFATRPLDSGFEAEIADVWRRDVEPALLEIRESLAEHSLLRDAGSIIAGDPRRLLAEAGGVLVVAHSTITSLTDLMVAGATIALPAADVLGRAIAEVREARTTTRKNPFFFLHRLADEAERHAD